MLVIDTDVLIDYLCDQPDAVALLEGSERPLAASVVTIAELYAGVREGEERHRLDAFVSAFEVLPLERLSGAGRALATPLQPKPRHRPG